MALISEAGPSKGDLSDQRVQRVQEEQSPEQEQKQNKPKRKLRIKNEKKGREEPGRKGRWAESTITSRLAVIFWKGFQGKFFLFAPGAPEFSH